MTEYFEINRGLKGTTIKVTLRQDHLRVYVTTGINSVNLKADVDRAREMAKGLLAELEAAVA